MKNTEYLETINKLKLTWPHIYTKDRCQDLWIRWSHLEDGVFSRAVQALIDRGGNAPLPGIFAEAIEEAKKPKRAPSRPGEPEIVLQGCVECNFNGYRQFVSPESSTAHAYCESCELGLSKKGQLPSGEMLLKRNYYRRKTLSELVQEHPEATTVNENVYGSALAALFLIVQRTQLTGNDKGLDFVCRSFGITRREGIQLYELMKKGIVTDQMRFLRNRHTLARIEKAAQANRPEEIFRSL